jgi:hypothetical protein
VPHSELATLERALMVGSQPRSSTSGVAGARPANTGYGPADRMLEKAAALTVQADELSAAQVRRRRNCASSHS